MHCTDVACTVYLPVSMVTAQHVLTEPSEVSTMSGQKLPLRMSVGESGSALVNLSYKVGLGVRGKLGGIPVM